MEGKRFQIRTDKKIDSGNDIRWTMEGGIGWFTFTTENMVNAYKCDGGSDAVKEEAPFFQQAGVLTFLKTSTQLLIWFDGVLEVTWVYKDKESETLCAMRNTLSGLKFHVHNGANKDRVSTHYRYQTGDYDIFGTLIIITIFHIYKLESVVTNVLCIRSG